MILVEIFTSSLSSFADATTMECKCKVSALEVPKTDPFVIKKRCSFPYHCLVFSGPKNSWKKQQSSLLCTNLEREEKSENQIYTVDLNFFLSYP